MQKTNINPEVLSEVLGSAKNAHLTGQSQFFTPLEFGRQCVTWLPRYRPVVVDLNCGAGHLLHAAAAKETHTLLGCDIDPCRKDAEILKSKPKPDPALSFSVSAFQDVSIQRITRDLTHLYPLLQEAAFEADLFVLNPPFTMQWDRERLALLAESKLRAVRVAYAAVDDSIPHGGRTQVLDSTIATMMIALDLMSHSGEGLLIANNRTIERLILAEGAPFAALADHIWARVCIEGNPMTGRTDCNFEHDEIFQTAVVYFAAGHTAGPGVQPQITQIITDKAGPGPHPCPSVPSVVNQFPPPERFRRLGSCVNYRSDATDSGDIWRAVGEEVASRAEAERANRPRYHLWLEEAGEIKTNLSSFEKCSRKVDKAEAARLTKLDGLVPMQTVLQRACRDQLLHVIDRGGWSVHPALRTAIQAAILSYHAGRAPLSPLNKFQSLGYLEEQDSIECVADLFLEPQIAQIIADKSRSHLCPSVESVVKPLFVAGQSYPLRTQTAAVTRVQKRPNPVTGEMEDLQFKGEELATFLTVGSGDAAREYSFMDARLRNDKNTTVEDHRHLPRERGERRGERGRSAVPSSLSTLPSPIDFALEDLCNHFLIPEVPDVATTNPEGFRRNIAELAKIEEAAIALAPEQPTRSKNFQVQDLARGALHDGFILAWDTGLGKTRAALLWPMLKCGWTVEPQMTPINTDKNQAGSHLCPSEKSVVKPLQPVLIVAPGDLHQQITTEAAAQFKINLKPMTSQDDFFRLTRNERGLTRLTAEGKPVLPPAFYLTSYTQLTTNGVLKMPDPDELEPEALLHRLLLPRTGLSEVFSPAESASPEDLFRLRTVHWNDSYDCFGADEFTTREAIENIWSARLERWSNWADEGAAASARRKEEPHYLTLLNLTVVTSGQCQVASPEADPLVTRHSSLVTYASLAHSQRAFVTRAFLKLTLEEFSEGIDEIRINGVTLEERDRLEATGVALPPGREIKCIYSPSLADLAYRAFGCVVVDEGVKMKGETTLVGMGVRQMQPEYRLVLSATAIKNRLPDIFRLAWWAAGGKRAAHARFPYKDASSERESFSKKFMVAEHNLTRAARAKEERRGQRGEMSGSSLSTLRSCNSRSRSRFTKLTPQVCNIHLLWKLFGPLILRRRKKDCGEDIVKKLHQVIRVQMGSEQKLVYQYHVNACYLDKNDMKAIGAQIQALRMAAISPAAESLENKGVVEMEVASDERQVTSPEEDLDAALGLPRSPLVTRHLSLPFRSTERFIPKIATALNLIKDILRRGEQVMLFSAFKESLHDLGGYLGQAGVRHHVLTGDQSQKTRGNVMAAFKLGRVQSGERRAKGLPPLPSSFSPLPVILASVDAMAEGHSCPLANNVILISYSWAMDKFRQAIDRVYRLNSRKDVNVFSVLCESTVDARLESSIRDKGDASDLVLDGELMGETPEEMNLFDLLKLAQEDFDPATQTIDESVLRRDWPRLQNELRDAQREWDTDEEGVASDECLVTSVSPSPSVPPLPSVPAPPASEPAVVQPAPAPLVTRHSSPVTSADDLIMFLPETEAPTGVVPLRPARSSVPPVVRPRRAIRLTIPSAPPAASASKSKAPPSTVRRYDPFAPAVAEAPSQAIPPTPAIPIPPRPVPPPVADSVEPWLAALCGL